MTYAEKLKDPRWQKKRLEVMERDQWKCKKCNCSKSTLQVHHKTYEYGIDPWDYQDINFITLCENCHKTVEYEKSLFTETVKYLLKNNIGYDKLLYLLKDIYFEIHKANEQKEQNNG
jgi:5-methylcytosine-specific restriction endonuclease McrA